MSVCNNKASTKAFLDALALSATGDTIEVPLPVGSPMTPESPGVDPDRRIIIAALIAIS